MTWKKKKYITWVKSSLHVYFALNSQPTDIYWTPTVCLVKRFCCLCLFV